MIDFDEAVKKAIREAVDKVVGEEVDRAIARLRTRVMEIASQIGVTFIRQNNLIDREVSFTVKVDADEIAAQR